MDTLCFWIINDLQSAEPPEGHEHSGCVNKQSPSFLVRGSTLHYGALGEHHGTTCSSIRSLLATRLCHGSPWTPGNLLGAAGSATNTVFPPVISLFSGWFYPLPLTVASGHTLSFFGLDTASAWTGQRPPVLRLMEANENNKPQWHRAPLLLERAERWKSIR